MQHDRPLWRDLLLHGFQSFCATGVVAAVILKSDMLRVSAFQSLKQFIQRRLVFLIILTNFTGSDHFHAVCGHTADLLLREGTRLAFYLFTRIAQRATAIAKAETIHACLTKLIHKLQHCSVQFISGREDEFLIIKSVHIPNHFQHKRLFLGKQSFVYFLHCTAAGRTGIVCIVLAAEVVLTKFSERPIYGNLFYRQYCRKETCFFCLLDQIHIGHSHPSFDFRVAQPSKDCNTVFEL